MDDSAKKFYDEDTLKLRTDIYTLKGAEEKK